MPAEIVTPAGTSRTITASNDPPARSTCGSRPSGIDAGAGASVGAGAVSAVRDGTDPSGGAGAGSVTGGRAGSTEGGGAGSHAADCDTITVVSARVSSPSAFAIA